MSKWCDRFNCWCTDVEYVIGDAPEHVCGEECDGCDEQVDINLPK